MHPTQLYELLAALACGAVAYLVFKKKASPGTAFAVFFFLFSIFRYLNSQLRYQFPSALPGCFYPVLNGAIRLAAAVYIIFANFIIRKQ